VLATQRLNRRKEFGPRCFSRLLEFPSLSLVAPALWTKLPSRREIGKRIVAMSLLEQILTQPEVRRGQHVGIIRPRDSAQDLRARQDVFALIASFHPVPDGVEVRRAQPLTLGNHLIRNLEGAGIQTTIGTLMKP